MKWLILFFILMLLGGLFLSLQAPAVVHELDILEVNRIVRSIEEDFPEALSASLPDSFLAFTFVPAGESLLGHVRNRDTLVDVFVDGEYVGKAAFFHDFPDEVSRVQTRFSILFYSQLLLLAIACGIFLLYQYKTVLQPFRKLERFAARVAAGDLRAPLEMDRKNRFGAFSESFDLMREQLAAARENERLADISKKELVASLSHDIKTPAASIKIIAELYQQKHGETAEMQSIIGKVDQIDLLISNMFTATLEELKQLKVSPADLSTLELEKDIRASDDQKKIRPFRLPECVVTVDRLRFQQVMDNVIGNAYKYAGTELEVTGGFDGAFFVLTVRDFGPGVAAEELPLLREKFYRASNAEGKSGSGLGLYLADYFLKEMGGSLSLESQDGLCVIMRLKI